MTQLLVSPCPQSINFPATEQDAIAAITLKSLPTNDAGKKVSAGSQDQLGVPIHDGS